MTDLEEQTICHEYCQETYAKRQVGVLHCFDQSIRPNGDSTFKKYLILHAYDSFINDGQPVKVVKHKELILCFVDGFKEHA